MPSIIELDISDLAIGKAIKIGDLDIPGVTFLAGEDQVIVAVRMKRGAIEDELEEGEGEEVDLESMSEEERAEYEKKLAEAAPAEGGDAPAAEGAPAE